MWRLFILALLLCQCKDMPGTPTKYGGGSEVKSGTEGTAKSRDEDEWTSDLRSEAKAECLKDNNTGDQDKGEALCGCLVEEMVKSKACTASEYTEKKIKCLTEEEGSPIVEACKKKVAESTP